MEISEQHALDDALAGPDSGRRAVRGSVIRGAGYGFGLLMTAIASVFLLRHLGVDGFGRYTTVVAIVTIVQGVTDAGLTVVGQGELIRADRARRRLLLADLIGIRLVLTPLGVAVGVAFTAVAGYPSAIVAGTALAGIGIVLAVVATALTLPLTIDLRFGAVTAIDLVRQLTIVVGIGVLVALSADLVPFFLVYIVAGLAAVISALAFTGRAAWVVPRFHWAEWRALLRKAAPVALGLVVNTTYVRIVVILTSLIVSAEQTGLFSTSYRIAEILLGVPVMMLGAAFPILVHANASDERRLAYALQRMAEASLLLGLALGLVLAVAAAPIVDLIGGPAYAGAAAPLRIQSAAIAGAFMTQLGTYALIAVERRRALVAVNVVAVVVVLALGCTLIPLWGAKGSALTASLGEIVLATASLTMVARTRPSLRPDLRYVPKLLLAAGAGLACALLPIPDVACAVVALAVYLAIAWLLHAIPVELVEALVRRRAPAL